ncbi:MAG: hypothetical protein OHK93_003779 [Ramalina farinacea]|uniref:Uncharacterized protein n=1 Tax=Ramalina farinacea TaxID=258253 RepID=A0AA43QU02_9LECA|nr:hypothetical protein [Ramalina farinacea]
MPSSILTLLIATVLSALLTGATPYPDNASSKSLTRSVSSSCNSSSGISLSNITDSTPSPVGATIHIPIPSTEFRLAIDEMSPYNVTASVLQLLVRALASDDIFGHAPTDTFSMGNSPAQMTFAGLLLRFYGRTGDGMTVGLMVAAMEILGGYICSTPAFGEQKRVFIEHAGGQSEGLVVGYMLMDRLQGGCGGEDGALEQDGDGDAAVTTT